MESAQGEISGKYSRSERFFIRKVATLFLGQIEAWALMEENASSVCPRDDVIRSKLLLGQVSSDQHRFVPGVTLNSFAISRAYFPYKACPCTNASCRQQPKGPRESSKKREMKNWVEVHRWRKEQRKEQHLLTHACNCLLSSLPNLQLKACLF